MLADVHHKGRNGFLVAGNADILGGSDLVLGDSYPHSCRAGSHILLAELGAEDYGTVFEAVNGVLVRKVIRLYFLGDSYLDDVSGAEIACYLSISVYRLVVVLGVVDLDSHRVSLPVGNAETEFSRTAAVDSEGGGVAAWDRALLSYLHVLIRPVEDRALVHIDVYGVVAVHIDSIAELCEALHAASGAAPEMVEA